MILEDVLPGALSVGLSYHSLFNMNPRVYRLHAEAYVRQRKEALDEDNLRAWLAGQYVLEAVATAFGKNHKYPKKPIELREKKPLTMFELRDKIMARARQLDTMRDGEEIIGEPLATND